MNAKILANIIDFLSDIFEHLSPALFRMLSTILPYLTPLPVAYITAQSATSFLGLDPRISGVLVFTLEGIGVWVTSELVDSFVDAIRSRNVRAWGIVIFLGAVVAMYVTLLITLNVVLEQQVNNEGSARSLVLTIICFLPLISGSLNGYRKTKLELRTNLAIQKEHQEHLDERLRTESANERLRQEQLAANERVRKAEIQAQIEQAKANERLEKYRIKQENERTVANEPRTNDSTNVRKRTNAPTNERSTNGDLRTFVIQLIDEYERTSRSVAGVSEIAKQIAKTKNQSDSIEGYERYKGYVSDVRKQWLQEHPKYLQ